MPFMKIHNYFNDNVIEEISMINKKKNAVIDDEISNMKQMRRNNSDNSLIE